MVIHASVACDAIRVLQTNDLFATANAIRHRLSPKIWILALPLRMFDSQICIDSSESRIATADYTVKCAPVAQTPNFQPSYTSLRILNLARQSQIPSFPPFSPVMLCAGRA
jgi:hypothetical protein